MRALFPAPRRCRAPGCSAASPTRRTGAGGVFPEPPAAGGGGLEVRAPTQAPPPRGSTSRSPQGRPAQSESSSPPHLKFGAEETPVQPLPHWLAWGTQPSFSSGRGCSTQRGWGSTATAPPPSTGVAAEPRLPRRTGVGGTRSIPLGQ